MNIIWVCVASALAIASVSSDQNMTHISFFPSVNQSVAGVIQVSSLNDRNQLHYAFNASEARRLCHSLRLSIASKAQVEEALTRGLETCRFGWIDEHFVVVPRVHALANCGKNLTGLVKWRASVTSKFDVFCFNESDAESQLKDTATGSPLSSRYNSEPTFRATKSTLTIQSTSTSSHTPTTTNNETEPACFVVSVHNSTGAKAVLITCSCGLLLISVTILAYLKLTRRCFQSSDVTQQREYIQTEEWECAKTVTETKKVVSDDERIDVDDSTH
ncbi:lymphatic vessel endothelial hyaluronic acid receptor 1a [Leuresthes tenuis]|uniref:lymphatic vessel endothelial hyaluronic acid receptor 1a n=1 Tax=Leuresthes tenuis TaxID=355514 RepID=UPI003B511B70